MRAAESRGSKDIPRGQGCRLLEKQKRRGENRFKSFVHAARKPETGSFIRTGHMTGVDGLFKASFTTIAPNDE